MLRLPAEILLAMVLSFVAIFLVNIVIVSTNILTPESLEKVILWRTTSTRIAWILLMGVWVRTRFLEYADPAAIPLSVPLALLSKTLKHFLYWSVANAVWFALSHRKIHGQFAELPSTRPWFEASFKQLTRNPVKPTANRRRMSDTGIYYTQFPGQLRQVGVNRFEHTLENLPQLIPGRSYIVICSDALWRFIYSQTGLSRQSAPDFSPFTEHRITQLREEPELYRGYQYHLRKLRERYRDSQTYSDGSRIVQSSISNGWDADTLATKSNEPDEAAIEAQRKAILQQQEEQERQHYRTLFLRRTTFFAIRFTKPAHPRSVQLCQVTTIDKAYHVADIDSGYENTPKYRIPLVPTIVTVQDPEERIYNLFWPVVDELCEPAGLHMIFGVDGFSGSGKSHTLGCFLERMTHDLFRDTYTRSHLFFEAFQTLGTDVEPLDVPTTDGIDFERCESTKFKRLIPERHFVQKRTVYHVHSVAGLLHLLKATWDRREICATNNNATSSRTHLVMRLYAARKGAVSSLCLFDLAGNERLDAFNGSSFSLGNLDRTKGINESRMNIHSALEAAVRGKDRVCRDTAVSLLYFHHLLMPLTSHSLAPCFNI
jgi:hypothetical protein